MVVTSGALRSARSAWRRVIIRTVRAESVDLTDRVAFTRFYLRVWALFFAEYLLMPLAVAVA